MAPTLQPLWMVYDSVWILTIGFTRDDIPAPERYKHTTISKVRESAFYVFLPAATANESCIIFAGGGVFFSREGETGYGGCLAVLMGVFPAFGVQHLFGISQSEHGETDERLACHTAFDTQSP